MSELKPCPFCGSEKVSIPVGVFQYAPTCENFHQGSPSFNRSESIKDWNTRPIEDELRAEIARLRAALEAVEWVDTQTHDYPGEYCPWCDEDYHNGHAPDCQRQIALGLTEGR